MSARASAWLARSLAALSVAMLVASVALYALTRFRYEATGGLDDLLVFVPFIAFPLVGALVASRRPANPVGWICLVAGLFWMLIILGDQYDAYSRAMPGPAPDRVTIDALTQWLWVPPVGLLGVYLILLFPDGRLPSRRWRPLVWLAGTVMVLFSVAITLTPGPLEGHPGVRNPFGLEWLEGQPWVPIALVGIVLLLPLCILASALSLVIRYRRSGDEVRQQIKWIALAASFVGFVYLSSLLSELVFAPESLTTADTPPLWVTVERNLLLLSYASIPVAVGFAVLRHRLYDIDVLINRALVYGSLTAMLAVTYFGGVAAGQALLRALTGRGSTLAIVASTLIIAALFSPLRRRVQSFIDRRFYRRKYDAEKTLEAFSAKLRDETDLDRLGDEMVGVVRETMQPAHAALWLRPASTLSENGHPD
jgi:hypothetical protein